MKLDILLRRYFWGRPYQYAAGDGPPVQSGIDLRLISRSEHVGLRAEATWGMVKPINSVKCQKIWVFSPAEV